jgi:hypothetical protein
MEKVTKTPWAFWQPVLLYAIAASLVALATVMMVDLKAKNMVVYQPPTIQSTR